MQDSAIQLSRPDHHTCGPSYSERRIFLLSFCRSKAVAAGAASFFLDQFVTRRVAKFTYGVELFRYYDELNPEHWLRRNQTITMPSGKKLIPGGFSVALAKVSPKSFSSDRISVFNAIRVPK